jgi:hypothetical protein
MPYVTCPHCRVLNYVPLSYLQRGERCPACDGPLGERANAVSPALAETAADGHRTGRLSVAVDTSAQRGPASIVLLDRIVVAGRSLILLERAMPES